MLDHRIYLPKLSGLQIYSSPFGYVPADPDMVSAQRYECACKCENVRIDCLGSLTVVSSLSTFCMLDMMDTAKT